jgi:hypothetical protein
MITLRIYNGETAEEIGIPQVEYESRKAPIDRFLLSWSGEDFLTDYFAWLPTQDEGGANDGQIPCGESINTPVQTTPPQMPSLVTRTSNLTKAMFRFVVEGMPIESKPEATRRLEICETNECGYFDGSICRHTKCGCFSKIKTFFATEHCPLGHW